MIGDSIRRVRLAEDEAEDIIENAAEEVERLRSDARNDYSLSVMKAVQKAREEAESVRAQALHEAEEEIKALTKSAKIEREMLTLDSNKKVEDAVRKVLEMLRADWFH